MHAYRGDVDLNFGFLGFATLVLLGGVNVVGGEITFSWAGFRSNFAGVAR